ncbi:TetR/AcrR family transcriptional regulator [Enterococcus rotai]|uniref:TetR/AcrR family transcriptional regulator n=1 Tax=Enterococcus rotai TaxID=118060 RepID=UPI0032B5FBF6
MYQEANVGRKTFYRYFKNKEAVLERALELLFLEYTSLKDNYYLPQYEDLLYHHFHFWSGYTEYLRILYKNDLMFYLFKQYQKYIPKLNHEYRSQKSLNNKVSDYANAFTIGIFWSILYTWVENGTKESAKELVEVYSTFINNKVE